MKWAKKFFLLMAFVFFPVFVYAFNLNTYRVESAGNIVAGSLVYQVKQGEEIRDVLYRWTKKNGWQLVWDSKYRYISPVDVTYNGSLLHVIEQLIDSMGNYSPKLHVTLYSRDRIVFVTNVQEYNT